MMVYFGSKAFFSLLLISELREQVTGRTLRNRSLSDDCNNLDACHVRSVDDNGVCVPKLIDCDDKDVSTIDVCDPLSGCKFITIHQDLDYEAVFKEELYFYEDESSLDEDEELAVIKWIKTEVTQLRTPFCWKQSYGRGFGEVLTKCPSHKEKIGALCYSPCPSGYSRQGTFDCQQECKPGWRDDGLFCRLPEYGRGAGYPWKFGDALNDSGMYRRCERDHGRGRCEKHLLIVYPKCKSGYKPFGCCICRPSFSSCPAEGYADFRLDLSCAVKIQLGDPTILQCRDGLDQDGLLCYPHCDSGYNGVGPVCWQQCDSDQVNCGAACAKSSSECALAVANQVIAPLIVLANIVTFGLADAAADAANAVKIGAKFVTASTRTGRAMLKMVSYLQTISKSTEKATKVVRRFKQLNKARKVAGIAYGAWQNFGHLFAQDFADRTSPQIAAEIDSKLTDADALYVKKLWAQIQFDEMRAEMGWAIAETTLAVAGFADPTGVVSLVGAYAKPTCLDVIPFPTISTPPQARCKDITLSADLSCSATVGSHLVDDGSFDPDESTLSLELSTSGPFGLGDQEVVLKVTDRTGEMSSCTSKITVVDDSPPNLICNERTTVENDPGECSAIVNYDPPIEEDNCGGLTVQTEGLPSGLTFPVGSTRNAFHMTDWANLEATCSFNVTVKDVEPPVVSCSDLETTIDNDPGYCSAIYSYSHPMAADNCDGVTDTSQIEGPALSLDPFLFPVGTTNNTFQATDLEGNYDTCSFNVTVEDVEAPVLQCPPDFITKCGQTRPWVTGLASAGDNCGEVCLSHSDTFSVGDHESCPRTLERNWKAQDLAGNSVLCKQKIVELSNKPDAVTGKPIGPSPTTDPTPAPTEMLMSLSPNTPAPTPVTPEPTNIETPAPTPFPSLSSSYMVSPTLSAPEPTTETPEPTPAATPPPTPGSTPRPTPGPTPGPTSRPTPGPTPGPTPRPTLASTTTETPAPTMSPSPAPTGMLRPGPTPNPTQIEVVLTTCTSTAVVIGCDDGYQCMLYNATTGEIRELGPDQPGNYCVEIVTTTPEPSSPRDSRETPAPTPYPSPPTTPMISTPEPTPKTPEPTPLTPFPTPSLTWAPVFPSSLIPTHATSMTIEPKGGSGDTDSDYVYNVFHCGTPGDPASFVLDIPYPFVTDEETPKAAVHAYNWLELKAGKSGKPYVHYNNDTAFYTDDITIELTDYDPEMCGMTVPVRVDLVVPETGFIHLTLRVVRKKALPDDCSVIFSVSGAETSNTNLHDEGW